MWLEGFGSLLGPPEEEIRHCASASGACSDSTAQTQHINERGRRGEHPINTFQRDGGDRTPNEELEAIRR
jgi:hypothetical protein